MLKGGILGFGGVGQLKAHCIRRDYARDDVNVVAAYDIDEAKLRLAREKYGIEAASSPEDLVSRDIDFVIVSSTNAVHAEQVVLAARAGKHVMVDKPPALTLAQADAMIAAVEEAGVVNVVDYSSRFGDYTMRLREQIRSGALGEILQLWINVSRDFGLASAGKKHWAVQHPELSGGWILHHMCHAVDLAYWLLGEFADVYCRTRSTFSGEDSPETVSCMATMRCGTQATLMDRVSVYRYHSLGVVGEKGTVVIQGPKPDSVMEMKDERTGTVTRFPAGGTARRATDHFIRCLKGEERSGCTVRDARESVRVCLAMIRSAREGGVVGVGEDP